MPRACDACGQIVHRYAWPLCPHEAELQRYIGPKGELWAAEIVRIEKNPPMRAYPSNASLNEATYMMTLKVANPMPGTAAQGVTVDEEWVEENEVQAGGFYCVDADDAQSYIPAGAFYANFRATDAV